ncbi:MAG: RHS repeat-associated core domain-containing protein [Paludibacter sp.]|nr:RHS repeat-associated core domain-containing protein [Paludibacter sp.]
MVKGLEYDAYGRIYKETFPSGYYTVNNYDSYGNLNEVTDKYSRSIWKATEANARGQITRLSKGIKETVYGYDEAKGQLTSMVAVGVVNYSYGYDAKNNLEYRGDNLLGHKEHFSYDSHNRLTNWDIMNSGNAVLKANSISYDGVGNIAAKSDLDPSFTASFNYAQTVRPHALTSVSPRPAAISADELAVTYTDFRKMKTLSENGKNYSISYGVDDQRRMSVQTQGAASLTRYYVGNYEEETDNLGNVKKIHYLSGGAMMVNLNGVETLYYGYADNQGSLIALTDVSGNVVEKYAFDPWGARRNPNDWTQKDTRNSFITNRGYTGHEHLDAFGIINMNGRVYDPLTAMFFSPDPFIQSAGDWKNYNRYSYCMNNPTKYTDPSGYQQCYVEMPSFVSIDWGFSGGSSGGGRNADVKYWFDHQGPISYNDKSGKFEYVSSGAEASWDEAMRNQKIDVPATLALGFQIAKQQGWAGDYNDFTSLYDQRTANNSYNGAFTLHTFESFYVIGGAGSKQTGSISLILEKGLGGGGYQLADKFGQLMNAGGVVYGSAEMGLQAFRQGNGAQIIGRAIGFGTQQTAKALSGTLGVVSKVGKGLGVAGYALSAASIGLKYATGQSVSTAENVGFGISSGIVGAGWLLAGTVGAPVVAGAALIYGAGELGSYLFTGNTLEENIFGK